MKAEDRRELVLVAATVVFGDYGYVGATTDRVAKAAGVSQPYVVRMFGTKEQLFLEVLRRALDRLLATFRGVLADPRPDVDVHHRLGVAYVELLDDRGLLLSLMHAFVLGSDPVIGPYAREGYLEVYALLREEAGFDAGQAREFLAGGMLINTVVGLRMSDEYETNPAARELLKATVPEKLGLVLSLGRTQRTETQRAEARPVEAR
jgi:AcrR family transcriptional regulator